MGLNILFIASVTDPSLLMLATYDPWLVLLSVFIACAACVLGLYIVDMARKSEDAGARQIALASGAVALGIGVWSMHFIGMLALRLCTSVAYQLPLTLASVLPAVFAGWVALGFLIRPTLSNRQLLVSGTLMGAGIGAMHYLGMQAMQMDAMLQYQIGWFVASVAVAVVLSVLALVIGYGKLFPALAIWQRDLLGGTVMGFAIAGMHYTAMRAALFTGVPQSATPMPASSLLLMAGAVTLGVFILGFTVAGSNLLLRFRELARRAHLAQKDMQVLVDRLRESERELEMRVTQRTQALTQSHATLEDTAARLRTLVKTIPDLFWMKNMDGVYQACNRAFEQFFQVSESDIVGKTDQELLPEAIAKIAREADHAVQTGGVAHISEDWMHPVGKDQPTLYETIRSPIFDANNQLTGVLGIARDISARTAAEEEIRSLIHYDTLTRLPNRRFLMERLKQVKSSGLRHARLNALLFINLDNFKTINDTLGHDMGDQLLAQVAQRLQACVRADDMVARLGGDEFVVLLEDLGAQELTAATQAEACGYKILKVLQERYTLQDKPLLCSASIGVTLFGKDAAEGFEEPLKRADKAMHQAKTLGHNTLRFFDPQMQAVVSARAALELDLREAIVQQQFELHYQAQVRDDGTVMGAEALLRWKHPMKGYVPPVEFIPLAEDTQLILPLGRWVLEQACQQLSAWRQQPVLQDMTISVNVSARQLYQAEFVDEVLATLERSGADAHRLKLELTESLLVDDIESAIHKMTVLGQHGVRFSLDDFGTGYSSLTYLKRLPLDQLKIDQAFVRDVLSDPNDAAIAKMIISLGQALDLEVIAEGVETAIQRDFLQSQGCHLYQGYFYSKPVPAGDFVRVALASRAQTAPRAQEAN